MVGFSYVLKIKRIKDQEKRAEHKEQSIKSLTKAFEQTWGSVAISKLMVGLCLLVSLDYTLPPRCSIQDVILCRGVL